jgi:hypothetical protein
MQREGIVSASASPWRMVAGAGLALALAGCMAPAASSKGHSLQYVSGSDKAAAFRAADKTCNAYGRVAAVAGYDSAARLLTYRCIEP